MENPNITESDAENVLCESSRGMRAEDIIMPGFSVFRKISYIPTEEREYISGDGWCSATPWLHMPDGGDWDPAEHPDPKLLSVVYSPLFDAEHMASGGYINTKRGSPDSLGFGDIPDLPRSPVWDTTVADDSMEMLSKFDVGRKSEKSMEFVELSFDTVEFADRYPHLMDKLRIACAHHYGKPNNNKDYMDRINRIPELLQLISSRMRVTVSDVASKRKAVQVPDSREPNPMAKRTKSVRFSESISIQEPRAPSKSGTKKRVPASKGIMVMDPLVSKPCLTAEGTAWSICSNRIHNGITYRLLVSETQSREVMMDSFNGYKTTEELIAVANGVRQWCTPHNDAQVAINMSAPVGTPQIARFKVTQSKRRHSPGEPNISVVNSTYGCRVTSEHLMGPSNGCRLFESLALTLGGVLADDGFWYFRNKDLAVQHAMMHVVCSVGTPKFYERLRKRTLRDALATTESSGGFVVVGYTVIGGRNTPQGTVGYFMIAENLKPVDGQIPRLYFGFPNRAHAESLSGIGTGKQVTAGKRKRSDKSVLFLRML